MLEQTSKFRDFCGALSPEALVVADETRVYKTSFMQQVSKALIDLRETRDLVCDNYQAYVNFGIYNTLDDLTDEERDELDDALSNRLSSVKLLIDELHNEVSSAHRGGIDAALEDAAGDNAMPYNMLFREAVLAVLLEVFQGVSKMSGQLQVVRMKRVLDKKSNLCTVDVGDTSRNKYNIDPKLLQEAESDVVVTSDRASDNTVEQYEKEKSDSIDSGKKPTENDRAQVVNNSFPSGGVEDLEISQDMQEQLEQENAELQQKVRSADLDTVQAEQQLNSFSHLLSVFNEKLAVQSEVIQSIHASVEESVENIEKGNDELKKTDERMKNDIQLFLAFIIASVFLLLYDY